jgi:prevent-host-death family protein
MGTYGVAQAKAQLSSLLQAVENGEEVTITRRGIAVARLSPLKKAKAGIDWTLVDQTLDRSKTALGGAKLSTRLLVREMRDAKY